MNKKGLYFWIEMIFLVIIFVLIFVNLPSSSSNFISVKDQNDLENFGFNALRSLDNAGTLDNATNDTSFAVSNFTILSSYIRNSFPNTLNIDIEYFNGTHCRSEFGSVLTSCGNFTKPADTIRVEYTMARMVNATTLHLYLRRIF